MHRFLALVFLGTLLPVFGQTTPSPPTAPLLVPPRALPVTPAELAQANAGAVPTLPNGVTIHWYGHGFVLLTSSVGVRAAFDPFGPKSVEYKMPPHVVADFVLVSHEAEDHAYSESIFGDPQIFSSVTAIGLNRANGIPFYGVSLHRGTYERIGASTAFTLKFDGVKFCYLGQITQPLSLTEKEGLGKVDVLFLPVGNQALSVADLNETANQLGARIIVPIEYKTAFSGSLPLRTLEEYLAATKLPIQRFKSSEIAVSFVTLPEKPTLYLLQSPQ